MKTSQSILNTLTSDPHFRPLRSHRCYRTFLQALPERFQQAIGFVYVRNGVLYLALRHPGYKMELNYQKDLFLSLWKQLLKQEQRCEKLAADSVILFNSKYTTLSGPEVNEETIPYYHELAEGSFEDASTNPALHAQFERLRALIRQSRQRDIL
jgi:hypothetical protein